MDGPEELINSVGQHPKVTAGQSKHGQDWGLGSSALF